MTKVTFLGAGNIAFAIAGGLISNGHDPSTVVAADPAASQLARFDEAGVRTTTDNRDAVAGADVILLTVKPTIVEPVARDLEGHTGNAVVISVAAGITLNSLSNWLGNTAAIVRCMPNTPALVRQGITGAMAGESVTAHHLKLATEVLTSVGDLIWVDEEKDLDAVTAISGSGPAYHFLVMELMAKAATNLGLSERVARQLVVKTALGAATMVIDGTEDIGAQRKAVTSPGGTTAAAIQTFLDGGLEELVMNAVGAAHKRAIELSAE